MVDVPHSTGPKPGDVTPMPEPIKQWLRLLRIMMAAIAVFVLFKAWPLMISGHLPASTAFIAGAFGTLGLSALVEAIWPDGDLGLLQFWTLTAIAATGLAAWASGGPKWIGVVGLALFALSFALAAMTAAYGAKRNRNAS